MNIDVVKDQVPQVSVVITTIRRPDTLRVAIDGVLRQTLEDFELIVVIDGPDEATANSVREIADTRVRALPLAQNVGLAEARNQGVHACRGEWIAFLDDDDEWLPEKLELQLKKGRAIGGPDVLVVGRYLERTHAVERVWPETLPSSRERFSEYMFLRRGQLLPSTYFVSAALVRRIPFTKGLRHIEDVDWLLRLAADPAFRIGGVEETIAIYNNFPVAGRESRNIPWETYYSWAVSRRHLFTPSAFSVYLVKSVVPMARESKSPLRERFMILSTALLLGSSWTKVLFFFVASAFFSRETKRRMRELVSPSARRVRLQASRK